MEVKNIKRPSIKLPKTWKQELKFEFEKDYMNSLRSFLVSEAETGKILYPKAKDIFNALNHTDLDQVKVVILGQDPYHGPGQAHGLSFSVKENIAHPPSLKNIFKELWNDLEIPPPKSGDLTRWADQGVLLLNATLTVEAKRAGSHQNKGWEQFTDKIIEVLNTKRSHIVYLLWGSYAQKKAAFVNSSTNLILKSPHPSPLSAHRGFLGCKHFSKANEYLIQHGITPIIW